MADAAAFFAKKKKKGKKAFKFNANTIDASQVSNTVHVDAPAISNNGPTTAGALPLQTGDHTNDDSQWDDEALAAKTSRKGAAMVVPAGVTTKELVVETKALSLKTHTGGNEQQNIAEKLRVEETKKKLAAARKGMEREALRLKEEKEKKEEGKAATGSSRFGAAAAAGGGGTWKSSRLRSSGGGLSNIGWGSKMGGSSMQRKVDTEDENLFPDLAAADAILEKQKSEQPAYKAPTKTPVGGGATWGASSNITATAPKSRPKLNLKKKVVAAAPAVAEPAPKTEEAEASTPAAATTEEPAAKTAAETTTEAPAAVEATAAAPLKPKKKKKKKDLSTFGK